VRAQRQLTRLGPAVAAAALLAACEASPRSLGVAVQDDAHPPQPWRPLSSIEQASFDLGYSVFNTDWVPANSPPGRIDGLGPVFNSQSCDACHNSRRRGRGPRGDGDAPPDLVIQLGRLLRDRSVQRGTAEYGYVLNPLAIKGFKPEARISIRYEEQARTLVDGTRIELRAPHYQVSGLSGPALPPGTVLMPRLPPPVQGAGLLERVPQSELARIAAAQAGGHDGVHGRVAVLGTGRDAAVGRFGWQASEPSVASQIGNAFAREMGLSNPLVGYADCGAQDIACQSAPTGGTPEVEPELFNAVVSFQRLHAVPVRRLPDPSSPGARLFEQVGCAQCHRMTLRVGNDATIHPYTDLLVHDMGEGLADRDIAGDAAHDEWRTAPLWGMNAAYASGQPQLLHDGRARSMEEAVLWHAGEGQVARERFARLSADERRTLVSWVEQL
jgi:CxxC motif-containing protein (DUF1111 family)